MKKFLLSLAVAACVAGVASAETVTTTFSALGYTNGQAVTTVNANDDITLTFDKGSGSSAPAYYNTGSALRLYASNTVTISASADYQITKVEFGTSFATYATTSSDPAGLVLATGEWTGAAQTVKVTRGTGSGNVQVKSMTVTYESLVADHVATPSFSIESTREGALLTMSCTTEGAKIYYTNDGTEPTTASTLYTAPVEVWEKGVEYKAVAEANGKLSSVASYTVDFPDVMPGFDDMIGYDGDNLAVVVWPYEPMTVVYQNGAYLYLRSGYSNMLIYGTQPTYNPGDRIEKLEGTLTVYNQLPEITGATLTNAEPLAGEAVQPTPATLDMVQANMLFHYLQIEGVEISDINGQSANLSWTDEDGTTYTALLYNQFKLAELEEGTNFTITGFVSRYKDNVQFHPTAIVKAETLEAPVFTPESGSRVARYTEITLEAGEGCQIWYKDASTYDEFERYLEDSKPIALGAPGATYTIEAYAKKDNVVSRTVSATYTIGKMDPNLQFIDPQTNEPISEYTVTLGEVNDFPFIDGVIEGEYTITSSDPAVATVDPMDGNIEVLKAGQTVITFSVEETSQYEAGTASYTLIVEDNAPGPEGSVASLIQFQNQTAFDADHKATFVAEDGMEFTAVASADEDAANWPKISSFSGVKYLRIYNGQGNVVTFTAPADRYFQRIVASVDIANTVGAPAINGVQMEIANNNTRAAESLADYYYDMPAGSKETSFELTCTGTKNSMRVKALTLTTDKINTSVEDVTVDANAPVEYYNLQGIRVENPESGLYIRRQGNQVSKVVIR